jgi:hypothetical protein
MIGNVQIIKNSGESLVTNGIAHFQFKDNQKQYIIYYLGEQINELLKIHIGYENAPVTDEGITEEDSAKLTDLLKKIGRNEDVSSIVTFLPLSAELYHVHDKEKKVALQGQAFNNIITAQQAGQIQNLQGDEPIYKENTFFDSSALEEPKKEIVQDNSQSIFENPIMPNLDSSVNEVPSNVSAGENAINNDNGLSVSSSENVEVNELSSVVAPVQTPMIDASANVSNVSENSVNEVVENSQLEVSLDSTINAGADFITNEQAKEAIAAIENAQTIINTNVELIKTFIKQQNMISDKQNFQDINANVNTNLNNAVVENNYAPNILVKNNAENAPEVSPVIEQNVVGNQVDVPAMTSEVTSLPKEYDIVNNIELAPQPAIAPDVLGVESELTSDYQVDMTTAKMDASIDTDNSFDTSVAIPSAPLTNEQPQVENIVIQNDPSTVQNEVDSKDNGILNQMIDTSVIQSQPVIEEQIAPVEAVPVQSVTGYSNIETPINNVNDNLNSSNYQENSGAVHDNSMAYIDASYNGTVGVDNSNVINNDSQVAYVSTPNVGQVASNNDIQQYVAVPNVQEIPVVNNENINQNVVGQNSGYDLQSNGLDIPAIDLNVNDMTAQTNAIPVVIPDGQNVENNQELVLTPAAFDMAA